MSCNEIKKQIHQALNGEISPELFAAHLESCADCRAYYERMLKQQKMLAELSPKDAPQFDLLSAKRAKKTQTSRTFRRITAVAAAFVAVMITGSLTLIGVRSFDSAEKAEGSMITADAPMEEAPMADAPAADVPMEEAPMADAPEADDAMCYAPEEPQNESDASGSYAIAVNLSAEEYDALYSALEKAGISLEPDEFGFYIHPDHDTMDTLSEILLPYLGQELTPEIGEIFISKY